MKKLNYVLKIIFIFFLMNIYLSFFPNGVYAKTNTYNQISNIETNADETIKEQQEEFEIYDFIKKSKEYAGEFFEQIDINQILNDAIKGKIDNSTIFKRILNLLGSDILLSIKGLVSILIIIIIHSILKSISESLENDGVAKLIYYVQYILIVTIIMKNFSDIVQMVRDTCTNLVAFMNMLVPLLVSLMLYTGSITTSGIIEPIILFMINFTGNLIQTVIIPLVLVFASLIIISKISDRVQIDRISNFLKSSIVWFLGIILTIFVGIVSLEGTLSSSVDGITAKTTKAIVSNVIPVVGKILGDAVETVLGCGIILKNAVGLVGIIIVIGICIMPILKLSTLTISYKLLAGVCQPIADDKIVKLLEQIGDIFKIFLAILCAISVMLIIGTTLVIKISNSGIMYR